MKTTNHLKLTLKINAAFSLLCGISLLLFHQEIATYMNIQYDVPLLFIGMGLLGFVGLLWHTANQEQLNTSTIYSIIIQDWLWVIGSIGIIGFQLFRINQMGFLLIGIIALIVADFAIIQHWLVRKI